MTNEEFAEQLAKSFFSLNDIGFNKLRKTIDNFLLKNHLQVISTKDQLLGYSVENVHTRYNESSEYKEKYLNAPSELTEKQAQYLLNLADRLNADHDYEFSWEDIDAAINQWLSEGCVKVDDY